MTSFVNRSFEKEVTVQKDNRDPQVIGEIILNRSKHLSALHVADQLSLMDIPDYRDK